MKVHHYLLSIISIGILASSCQKEPQVIKVESVALNTTSLTIVEGESQSLTATVSPSNADNKTVTWSSSNSSVATVDDKGTVTAVAAGTATITAKSDDGGKTATCAVTVKEKVYPVESVSLDKTTAEITEGETITLTATVKPDNATDKTVTWSSSDEAVATVKDGVVTAIKAGSATITAKAGEKTATCVITVKAREATNPFTITSVGSTSISIEKENIVEDISLEYRKGAGSWSAYNIGTKVNLIDGEYLQFRAGEGGNKNFSSYFFNGYYRFVVSGEGIVNVSGNIMSLLDRTLERNTMPNDGFCGLFYNCTQLLDASKLFLPAFLADRCYSHLFEGCTSLITAPKLPATALTYECYQGMFSGCTSLSEAPNLPATFLAPQCYDGMFSGCTSLSEAPNLPATSLAHNCYHRMFKGCTSLRAAPDLSATTLTYGCYDEMFSGCTSLTTAPALPATTLAEYCYRDMFYGCTSLTTAPALPATTLAEYCYRSMFSGCTSLTTAPALPATTLANYCYRNMFSSCTSLTTAPALPASCLERECYYKMFYGCSNLNYVKALFTSTPSDNTYTRDWLSGVSPTGTFVKSKNATWDVTGPNGIPSGWTVQIAE